MLKTLTSLEPILQAEFDPAFEIRARYILNTAADHKPKKVLDAGCGRGFYVHSYSYLPTVEEIHGVEINPKYIEVAKKHCTDERIKITEGSIYELPYSDNYFDFISCSEVLEHLSDDAKGLSELKRVLKPTGKLVVTVPNHHFPFLWDPLNWLLMKLFNTHINKDI